MQSWIRNSSERAAEIMLAADIVPADIDALFEGLPLSQKTRIKKLKALLLVSGGVKREDGEVEGTTESQSSDDDDVKVVWTTNWHELKKLFPKNGRT